MSGDTPSIIIGQDRAVESFVAARESGALHHAWLLSGPRGVGKALFAVQAATRLLADAAGPPVGLPGLATPPEHRIARLMAAGSHPDFRLLERLENKSGTGLARNITVDQVRELAGLFAATPALSEWRAVVIDSADDLERSAANALLKMLEEPPARSVFFLVSHAAGRLLPTIRSRCRRLEFQTLDDDAMAAALAQALPEASAAERAGLVPLAGGSVGRALNYHELDLAPLEAQALDILRTGDATNLKRSKLATALGGRGAAPRYAAFLELLPALVAREARSLSGNGQGRALDAYARVRETCALAPRLSLDAAATGFQLGTILASVAGEPTRR
ncbi:DNA polymerase III subunit delta' [Sphingomonas ginkgonis]|uniref:DNA polymerase III subunit delta n=1 Tax=Sphingomonas ginkgonis TaxID=2315330 RepID=A0A3R9WQM9_9SPHN|nr:DNA polymerase III subunit delta' [Sphingomonas ginkgonis]RST31096.1 DNA polymerase III subunit delta' [Sphingomonas ginkgonis]